MKRLLIAPLLLWVPLLPAQEQDADIQREMDTLWQEYAELGMMDQLLTELETESRQGCSVSREQVLTHTLLTHWKAIMQRRRGCNVHIHWTGDKACGSISYRTSDLPHELQQQLLALQASRTKTGKLNEEERNLYIELNTRVRACTDSSPDAGKIDQIIQLIYQEKYPQATCQLAELRREHPDYCPRAFAELAAALATPNRLQLLLLCTRLPLGVIRETHIVE